MITAFSTWNDRIAPVFDVAGRVSLVKAEEGKVVSWSTHEIPPGPGIEKAEWLTRMGVQNLVCGAISRDLEILIVSYGIRIIPFIAGETERIIQGWLAGASIQRTFSMPGCRRGWNRRMSFPVSEKEGNAMDRTRQRSRMRQEGGQGAEGGRRRERRMERTQAGPDGTCVCPQCGHREPHERGLPCIEKECPSCGQKMVRQ
jgi:predicted Fe-Mo cluster-binding NifX family protein